MCDEIEISRSRMSDKDCTPIQRQKPREAIEERSSIDEDIILISTNLPYNIFQLGSRRMELKKHK